MAAEPAFALRDPRRNALLQEGFHTVYKTAIVTFICALTVSTASFADHSGSAEDQLACTPDVYRLCSQFIPDEDTIVSCLQRNKPQLSAGCQAVFAKPQTAKPKEDTDDN